MLLLLEQPKTLIKCIQGLGRDHRHISASLRSFATLHVGAHTSMLNSSVYVTVAKMMENLNL